jgi:RNA polymerase sigma factor (sigma-70 family)
MPNSDDLSDRHEQRFARHDAFDSLMREYGSILETQARRLTGDPSVASDLLQDAFERGLRRAPILESHRLCRWLQVVMRNLAADDRRRRRAYEAALSRISVDPAESSPGVEASYARELREQRLQLAQASLEAPFRQVLDLYMCDASLEEIAIACHIRPATAGTRLYRARSKLRALLASTEPDLPDVSPT